MFSRTVKRALMPAATLYFYYHSNLRTRPVMQAMAQQSLSAYRPTDGLHLHYAVEVYQKNGGKLESGWQLLRVYQDQDGYFGAAYYHPQYRHIIIAHRGTEDFKDWICDFKTVVHHLNDQQVSAWDKFAKKIIEEHGPSYTYSFTGHSLGGWLSEVCLWKYQDEFVRDPFSTYQDAFSVTLDDPGGQALLEGLQPRTEKSYRIALDRLDRTNYLSRPNTINTALGREGATVYALLPEISRSWFSYNTLLFTAKMHNAAMLLKEFDSSGLPKQCYRVLDWPRVLWGKALPVGNPGGLGYLAYAIQSYLGGDIRREEYSGFYNYDPNTVNNPHTLPVASQFKLQHGVHYRTVPFQPALLPLRNMPAVARRFLEDLSAYPDRAKVITELMNSPVNPEFSALLNTYRIEREECVLGAQASARAFRQQLLEFLNKNPFLYQTRLAILREERILKQVAKGGAMAILGSLNEQVQRSKELVFNLSFNQGTARLYQFIKPTWDEVKSLQDEQLVLSKQLSAVQCLRLNLQAASLDTAIKTQASALLQQHEQQLQIAEQSAKVLMDYIKDKPAEADKNIDHLIATVEKLEVGLDKTLLLNRAYNLKAKIAARVNNPALARQHYQQATNLLPEDILTASNYGGLLTDLGRSTKNPGLYVEAYRYFQKVYPYLPQIEPTERPVVYSGMAYGFLLLAQSLEQKSIAPIPNPQQLRTQAQALLRQAILANPQYLNARLFLALLRYDEKNYLGALQEINMALTLQPMHPTALMRKGFILDKLEQSEEALTVLHQSKSLLNPGSPWVKEIDEKIAEIETGLTRKPKL